MTLHDSSALKSKMCYNIMQIKTRKYMSVFRARDSIHRFYSVPLQWNPAEVAYATAAALGCT